MSKEELVRKSGESLINQCSKRLERIVKDNIETKDKLGSLLREIGKSPISDKYDNPSQKMEEYNDLIDRVDSQTKEFKELKEYISTLKPAKRYTVSMSFVMEILK